ncbi:MAG: MFS transporter [Cyclobacteriaceae bacterium]|nr:MFS transporter [Cyclobacteriaceae bacterium]
MNPKPPAYIFYVIIISQFCCTSVWFASNAIFANLQQEYQWTSDTLGSITSAIQLGFIAGTLVFAITGISDRFSPSVVYLGSSILAALANLLCLIHFSSFELAITSRVFTGFFLAGVYPVGMKIASDWKKDGLGHWLGALVGALVLGTSFPHALKLVPGFVDPATLISTVSILSVTGGLAMYMLVKDGPFHKPSLRFSFSDVRGVFKIENFRAPAFGYFGHMWELYAFWAFIPVALFYYQSQTQTEFSIPLWSFVTIAAGFLGCVIGGKLSLSYGSKTIAAIALVCSGLCCILSPVIFLLPFYPFMAFLLFWGFMVVADSPQFSTLIAFHSPPQIRGSAITISTCIGFSVTIISIQLLNVLQNLISTQYLLLILGIGPALGLMWLFQFNIFKWKK